jgi:WD40 repeat protein/energy-coupling factor transporter ATP-binding protein EcfA2
MARAERPLDVGDGRLLEFAADLRRLRVAVGSPAYRELGRRAHYSATTLSDAAGGRRLPSLSVTLAYVAACEGDTAAWEQRWHALAAELADGTAGEQRDDGGEEQAPYVGLAGFQVEDAERFFGREGLVTELVDQVTARRFVVVVGPSGSGKSSLLRAGLVHHAQVNGVCGGGPVVVMTPGPHPLEECAIHLAALTDGCPSASHAALRTDPRCLHRTTHLALVKASSPGEVLVVVDQFEEVFTVCRDPDERAQFLTQLRTAAQASASRIRIVLGLRADFYAHCTHHPELVEALRDAQVLVGPMNTEELRSAITQPAHDAGCRVETALVSRVIADATGQPGVLPLVEHALLETWRRRRGTTLTLAGYDAAGGITQAIARTAETIYTTLPENQREWARQLFLRLVVLGEGTEDTRRRVHRDELDLTEPTQAELLKQLTDARLITLDRDGVEIAHEALIRNWPRLHGWLTDDRDGLRIHRQLSEATHTWHALQRDPGALYRGSRLSQADQWATATSESTLSAREREFLHASLTAHADEQADVQRRTRRLRRLVALLAVVAVLAVAATVVGIRAQQATANQARLATEQRTVAISQKVMSEAYALVDSDPNLAMQLIAGAYRLAPTPENRDNLLRALAINNEFALDAARFAPDDRFVGVDVTPEKIRIITLPGVDTNLGTTVVDKPRNINSITFSPNGRVLAIAEDEMIHFWNIGDWRSPPTLMTTLTQQLPAGGCGSDCFTLAFSPDGRLLSTAGHGRTTTLWNFSDPSHLEKLATIATPGEQVATMTFSPDGHTLATGSEKHTTRLWDITAPREPTELSVLDENTGYDRQAYVNIAESTVYSPDSSWLAFSPDGDVLAAASSPENTDHEVRLWDITNTQHPEELATVRGHTAPVISVAFSHNGHTLATASWDHTTRLWDITNPHKPEISANLHTQKVPGRLNETEGMTYLVSFLPDDRDLVVTEHAGYAMKWETSAENAIIDICHTSWEITRTQWNHYFPGIDYRPPCRGPDPFKR